MNFPERKPNALDLRRRLSVLIAALFVLSMWKSISSAQDQSSDSYDFHSQCRPYALILPGILGPQRWDRNIRRGILESGFDGDVEIYDWTKGPLSMPLNIGGDVEQAERLSTLIADFVSIYPSRPLFIIGHSGGCRMAIDSIENLSAGKKIERLILLSPCLESNYDFRAVMNRTKRGLTSFYSPLDFAITLPLTTAHGLAVGKLKPSAALVGFQMPNGLNDKEQSVYRRLLVQRKYQAEMLKYGNAGGHFGCTHPAFVSRYIASELAAKPDHRQGLSR